MYHNESFAVELTARIVYGMCERFVNFTGVKIGFVFICEREFAASLINFAYMCFCAHWHFSAASRRHRHRHQQQHRGDSRRANVAVSLEVLRSLDPLTAMSFRRCDACVVRWVGGRRIDANSL
jgi:hypothetical protein